MSVFLAHSDNESGRCDLLRDHLLKVSLRASDFAAHFEASSEARAVGLLHDIGKYGVLFQDRLAGKERGIDHWSVGAWIAMTKYQTRGIAAALAIQGHHTGLQTASPDALNSLNPKKLGHHHPLSLRLSESDPARLLAHLQNDHLQLPTTEEIPSTLYSGLCAPCAAAMLDVRMLYSALVDADFLETEAHFKPSHGQYAPYQDPAETLSPEEALSLLSGYIAGLSQKADASSEVIRLRLDLLESCLDAAASPPGVFTLTAPTGTGKTLNALAFALKHAALHGLGRIVVAIPFLSIIEQTASEYRKVFEPHWESKKIRRYVLEHHSLAGLRPQVREGSATGDDGSGNIEKLLSDNWDAPLIATTSVQLLESLFSNRPSACRKLHRLAGSVILLDEVQTLPVSLTIPTLATLNRLAEKYGASIVFSTATQPAFSSLSNHVQKYCGMDWEPREIVPARLDLFKRARRTRVSWPEGERLTWEEVANRIVCHEQALCIVNLKRHAVALFQEIKGRNMEGLFHLSTNMCPAHRTRTLNEVRDRLRSKAPCILVSTQCVEAGVDLDFPVVYRAFGPLEAIAQAAGRCNRGGHLPEGPVFVFHPEEERYPYPNKTYGQAAEATEILCKRYSAPDIHDPNVYKEYYEEFFDFSRPESRNVELQNAIENQNFAEVARHYRLIENSAVNALVAYDQDVFQLLAGEARETGLTRSWISRARPYAVSIFRTTRRGALDWLEPVRVGRARSDDWAVYLKESDYDPELGLMPSSSMECLIK